MYDFNSGEYKIYFNNDRVLIHNIIKLYKGTLLGDTIAYYSDPHNIMYIRLYNGKRSGWSGGECSLFDSSEMIVVDANELLPSMPDELFDMGK